jgi:TRAP-type uncharacterized transport system fused permease subunit
MAPLLGILSSLGVVVTLIARTGLTQQISTQMVARSGGVFIMLLFLSMVTSILFGLGLPTPAAYLLVVVLVAPALIGQGVQELTAHFFVFYFAMISAITPPVAIAVAVTSEIAGSNFLRTCWHALRIGCPGFIVPYAFITNESLIFWTFPATIFTTIFVLSGILALLLAVFAYDGRAEIGVISRVGLFIVAFVSMFGPMSTQIVAVSLLGTWLLLRLKFGYSLPIRKPA